ncbi:hypothetical protein [Vibrio parahaemolyticus]|uniref:hypothetical protein n=1 Tax=Vibrio parahaemolyticus TaxID=670 RepID=UPI0023ECFE5C|nr:hypothetical protein [Vibrio parahaemolyticus]
MQNAKPENNMPDFNLEDHQYLYNCAGDFVGDDIPAIYDIDKAKALAMLVAGWKGAEHAVVTRYGVLGVMIEIQFHTSDTRDRLIEKLQPVYEKYNGTQHIAIGLLEQDDECWPQLFIPALVALERPHLADAVREEYLQAVLSF